MSMRIGALIALAAWAGCHAGGSSPLAAQRQGASWTPLPLHEDPLLRQPGTQPADGVQLESPTGCLSCHGDYDEAVEPGFNWRGSMMAQAARDFLFWPALAVAAQDSIQLLGRPNATDMCLRCHMPKGWVEGRSDPPNGSALEGADFDGVQCDVCHRMFDPFFDATFAGTREGDDWGGYWDESNASATPAQTAATQTRQADQAQASMLELFNGQSLFSGEAPAQAGYTEAGSGQFYLSSEPHKRGPFADHVARHTVQYSRFHKSRFFCGTCHDVSNPVLANLDANGTRPNDDSTLLPSEQDSAFRYAHLERTFSEFRLSAYGVGSGAAGIGPFAPEVFDTSNPGNVIATCQDCHMRDAEGAGCDRFDAPVRPGQSSEHPRSGQPVHDFSGGNIFVPVVLASAVIGSPNYDATNAALLNQGGEVLTLDLTQGVPLMPRALLAAAERAKQLLRQAASIQRLTYDPASGRLSFRLQNQSGHKLISGYAEGRRMYVNVQAFRGERLVHEINPYDAEAATLKGLPADYSPDSPGLASHEAYSASLVYEMHPSSTLTGEDRTFHFALATGRHKDNRIPPKGFRSAEARTRQVEPVWAGSVAPDYFSADEYAGGYDDVSLAVSAGADRVVVSLYYQVTSREYVAFLEHELKGPPAPITLPPSAYVAQSDPFFSKLKAWGDTVGQLWRHNKHLPGAAPFLMTRAAIDVSSSPGPDSGSGPADAGPTDASTARDAAVADGAPWQPDATARGGQDASGGCDCDHTAGANPIIPAWVLLLGGLLGRTRRNPQRTTLSQSRRIRR